MFSSFNSVSKSEWLAKVEKDLKGKKSIQDFNWEIDGMTFTPFHHSSDLSAALPVVSKRANNEWKIGANIVVENPKEANEIAIAALKGGANALNFKINIPIAENALMSLLKDIHLEWITTHFSIKNNEPSAFLNRFSDFLQNSNQDLKKVNCSFDCAHFDIKTQLQTFSKSLPNARFLAVNALSKYKNKDSLIEELTHCLSMGNTYLKDINEQELSIKEYHKHIYFALTLSGEYFIDIAKIRALKILWKQLLYAWEVSTEAFPKIDIFLSESTQSEDEHYNKISATTQAMSAVIGGIDRLFIAPSDAFKNEKGSVFSRRIALNIQHLLQQESYLDRVQDPAAGSYFLEHLTNTIAEKTWSTFQAFQ